MDLTSFWAYAVFVLVLAPLGVLLCRVSLPMLGECSEGPGHRLLGGVVCVMGALLVALAGAFLVMAYLELAAAGT